MKNFYNKKNAFTTNFRVIHFQKIENKVFLSFTLFSSILPNLNLLKSKTFFFKDLLYFFKFVLN